MKPPVPHLDGGDVVSTITGLGGKLGHIPGVSHHAGHRVGAELLKVGLGKGALEAGRGLDEVTLPVLALDGRVLVQPLWPHGLQLRITFEAGIVAKRLQVRLICLLETQKKVR